jgi:UDP-glucose 4-epimerase
LKTVLVTGGAGYIGTHILVVLAARGFRCVSIDNYCNSSPRSIERVRRITGNDAVEAHEADIRDAKAISRAIADKRIDSVIHLAGLKAVGESVEKPQLYHDNNVNGTKVLLDVLAGSNTRNFVFSSSATVYGMAEKMPITEDAPTDPQSPYGETKLEVERLLAGRAVSDPPWKVINLRYFNPVGAHESGTIGEDPSGIPNNLMPYVCQVAAGRRDKLRVFGSDYPTKDGSGVRDYIHVMDLAEGHVAALDALDRAKAGSVITANLGTGRGRSVLELVGTFERVNGVRVAREFVDRRPGDVATCYADPSLAKRLLGWEARRGLEEMCRDAWNWQRNNPNGYGPETPSA